jgi:predicted transcriptional regulator
VLLGYRTVFHKFYIVRANIYATPVLKTAAVFGVGVMSHRRGEVEIMHDVLEVCLRGVNKTRIVYYANLNFPRLKRYLRVLLGLGFLVAEVRADGSVFYRTTPAGVYFLEGCSNIEGMSEKAKPV